MMLFYSTLPASVKFDTLGQSWIHIIELSMCDRLTESLTSLELGDYLLISLSHSVNYVYHIGLFWTFMIGIYVWLYDQSQSCIALYLPVKSSMYELLFNQN